MAVRTISKGVISVLPELPGRRWVPWGFFPMADPVVPEPFPVRPGTQDSLASNSEDRLRSLFLVNETLFGSEGLIQFATDIV